MRQGSCATEALVRVGVRRAREQAIEDGAVSQEKGANVSQAPMVPRRTGVAENMKPAPHREQLPPDRWQ